MRNSSGLVARPIKDLVWDSMRRLPMRRLALWLASAGALSVPTFLVSGSTPASAAKTAPGFGHATVVDHQRVAGEPSISISPTLNGSGHHDTYVAAPYGFSTTASFVWKSGDGGQTFHLIGSEVPPAGKPLTCAGGGDSGLANDSAGNLYFTDLQGLTDISAGVSTDAGKTFTSTCNQANTTPVDRPWLSTFGNPLTTGREYMTVDQIGACQPQNCGLGQTGANVVVLTQAAGVQAQAQVFAPLPAAQQIEPDGIVSGTVVNQSNGDLYIVHTGLTDKFGSITGGADANSNTNAIVVDRFPGGFSSNVSTPIPSGDISYCKPYNSTGPCETHTVFHAPLDTSGNSTATTGQDFSPMAIDSAGNLYVVWSQAPLDSTGNIDGPSTIFLATSTDQGVTWSKPINVSAQVAGVQTNLFPWITAGSNGRIDIVWFGTPTLGSCPNQPCGSSAINASWNVYMAQALNAVTATGKPNPRPTFSTTKVTEYPNHFGAICTMGLGCTTGGDRGLLDFLSVQVEPNGAADVVWADSANTDFNGGESAGLIAFAHQVSGPGLYGGTINGPAPALNSAPGSPDSYFAGNGMETAAAPNSNVDIVSSSISAVPGSDNDGDNDNFIKVTMKVGSLQSLAPDPTLGGSNIVWLTRWVLPSPHPTLANQGHIFYAAMESDNGGTPTFYDGDSQCGVATSHCKTISYAPQHTIQGSYTRSGTITLVVPVQDIGGKADAPIFSATGVTATSTQPSSSTSIFNVIDSTQPYNARTK